LQPQRPTADPAGDYALLNLCPHLRQELDKLARLALWWNNSALLDYQQSGRRLAGVKEA